MTNTPKVTVGTPHEQTDKTHRFKTTFKPNHEQILPALLKHWNLISDDLAAALIQPVRPSICSEQIKVLRNIWLEPKSQVKPTNQVQ